MVRRDIPVTELLANVALFQRLGPTSRARIAARARKLRLRRGEVLFRRGDDPAGFFVVVFGEMALLGHGARGVRLSGVVGQGRSFGEPVMFLGKPYIVDARAQTDALLVFVPKEVVFSEIDGSPAFAHRMIAGLAARIETLVREIDSLSSGTAQQRLVAYLLRAVGAREGPAVAALPTSKAAVASQLGLTAEHFSRLLRDLARRELLRVEGRRIVIADVRALAEYGSRPRRGRAPRAAAARRTARSKDGGQALEG
jgi:CRP-like cAMP-binding protein